MITQLIIIHVIELTIALIIFLIIKGLKQQKTISELISEREYISTILQSRLERINELDKDGIYRTEDEIATIWTEITEIYKTLKG